jgi:hypothetical protein
MRYGNPNEELLLKADVFVARSTDGGITWTEKMNVTHTKHIDEYELKAVRRASSKNNGTVYFAYCEVDPNEPVGQNDPDVYTYRTNRVWVGEAYDFSGSAIGDENPVVVRNFALQQNYPNPFNPTTTITFTAAKSGQALLQVYDVNGRLVRTIYNAPVRAHQEYQVKFDARDMASGIYFYRLKMGGATQTRKMILMR